MMKMATLLVVLVILFSVQAQVTYSQSLERINDCSGLLKELREKAIEKMEDKIDAALQLARRSCFGLYEPYPYGAIGVDTGAEESSPVQTDRAAEYSETNVQVVGVDEADFVKNDGSYIFILANDKFRIVDTWPPEEAFEVSVFEIEGEPKKMFVHNNRAFIYSSLEPIVQNDYYSGFYDAGSGGTECTYGYDCEFTGDGCELKITVLDISDLSAPLLIREMRFSGAYLNSRRIGNAVFSAVIFPEVHISGLQYWPDEFELDPYCNYRGYPYCCRIEQTEAELEAVFEALKLENRKIIQSANLSDLMPTMEDVSHQGGIPEENPSLFEKCDTFYLSEKKDDTNLLSIISMDINGTSPVSATTIIGKSGAIYASESSLYIAARQTQEDVMSPQLFTDGDNLNEVSIIHKFYLSTDPPVSRYAASGVVKGRVLNQFCMDEFDGFFRIATTTGHLPDPNTHSTISILEETSNQLQVVGQIDWIAPKEDIRSARFIGPKGYVVTFKKTDPLFVFDLSEPYQPKVAGELKIPGFSTYIHPIDGDHLLTIGYDTDDQGDFSWFQGIMLQIFNVSDMTNPTLTHKEVIGTRGSTSEAATNHLAFNYFASKDLLAIPMTICENDNKLDGYGGSYGDFMTFSGVLVYGVNVDSGFEPIGGISHLAPESQDHYRYTCYNWWTNSNTYVKRSIFMDDYVFSITEDTIKANRLSDIGKDISVIYFADQLECSHSHVDLCVTESDCLFSNGQWIEGACRLPPFSLADSTSSVNLCTASFDTVSGVFDIPCVDVAGSQYKAKFLTQVFPTGLALTFAEPADVRLASAGCKVNYDPMIGTLRVPCITLPVSTAIYWADFNIESEAPFTISLTDSGGIP